MATGTKSEHWTVTCGACHVTYDQDGGHHGSAIGPVNCGACGSFRVRVVQHVEVIDNRNTADPWYVRPCQCAQLIKQGDAALLPCEACHRRETEGAR